MHPLTKITGLIFLAVFLQFAGLLQISLVLAVLLLTVLYLHASHFLCLAKRVRWLVLVMVIIYAFNTPGEYVRNWIFEPYPTYEGLESGMQQALRLYAMLAGLTLLLASTTRNGLIGGLYLLLRPLRVFGTGFSPEQFSARLWLTLHYVESPAHDQPAYRLFAHFTRLELNEEIPADELVTIPLDTPSFTWRDGFVIMFLAAAGFYLA